MHFIICIKLKKLTKIKQNRNFWTFFGFILSKPQQQQQKHFIQFTSLYINRIQIVLSTVVVSELNAVQLSRHFAFKIVFFFFTAAQCFAWFAFLSQFIVQNCSYNNSDKVNTCAEHRSIHSCIVICGCRDNKCLLGK